MKYYDIPKFDVNKICTVLKYMSLIPPFERIDRFKNSISCEKAFNLLNTILSKSEWVTKEDAKKDSNLFVENDFKCMLPDDYCGLLDYIMLNYEEFEKKLSEKDSRYSVHSFDSNYDTGYYAEIYQRINLNYNCNKPEPETEFEEYSHIEFLLNELLKNCLTIERKKSYFARNIYGITRNNLKAPLALKLVIINWKNKDIKWNEKRFLYLFFDSLHNIPEYIEKLLNILNGKEENKFFFRLLEMELTDLYGLIDLISGLGRINAGINESRLVLAWIHDLQRLISPVENAVKILQQLKEMNYIEKIDSDGNKAN